MILLDKIDHLIWQGGAAIDADGSARAYGPKNSGLDYTRNAGTPGNYYGVLTDSKGEPILQGPNDLFPGMYISPTSLTDKGYIVTDTRRYVDAETVPFIAIPRDGIKEKGAKLGDLCVVYNKNTDLYCLGVVADVGPKGHWENVEMSIAMAKVVGIKNISPRNGGVSRGISCLLFKKSTKGWPRVPAEIQDQGEALLADFGGIEKLKLLK